MGCAVRLRYRIMQRTLQPGGIYSADRSITVDGRTLYLGPLIEYDQIMVRRQVSEEVAQERDEGAQDLSDAIWLREYGTIPGAPHRTPSQRAIEFSRITPL
jgi:hypothetical protein